MPLALDSEICSSILETLPMGLYVVDRERKIVFWNEAAEKMRGYLRHEVIGRACADEILMHCNRHGTILCGVACPLAGTMHDGHPRQAEVFMLHKSGHRVPVRVRATPVRNESGTIIGAAEIFEQTELTIAIASHESLERLLAERLADFEPRRIPFSVILLELKNLHHFAEMYGRPAVDEATAAVVDTMVAQSAAGDPAGLPARRRQRETGEPAGTEHAHRGSLVGRPVIRTSRDSAATVSLIVQYQAKTDEEKESESSAANAKDQRGKAAH